MSKGQRLGFIALAAAIAIVAIVLSASSGSDDETEQAATATPTPAGTAQTPEEASPVEEEPTATATPKPDKPPLLTAGKETTVSAKEGERVTFRVRHDTADHVHVHGYDIFKDLEPGKTATVSFKADIVGIFEIELEDSHQLLARLKVEP